ncbi:MAG TPA: hypothetical protein VHC44_14960, partial [Verrucomicrobiae bacterium]|nr:hypothetical protein [Verrucomicrobiae bacterium]
MALKRTIKFYAFLTLAIGCLNLLGQPKSSSPASAQPAGTARAIPSTAVENIPLRTVASLIRDWRTGDATSNEVVHVRGSII